MCLVFREGLTRESKGKIFVVTGSFLEKAYSISLTSSLEWIPTKLVYEAGNTAWFMVPIIRHDETRGSYLHFVNFVR